MVPVSLAKSPCLVFTRQTTTYFVYQEYYWLSALTALVYMFVMLKRKLVELSNKEVCNLVYTVPRKCLLAFGGIGGVWWIVGDTSTKPVCLVGDSNRRNNDIMVFSCNAVGSPGGRIPPLISGGCDDINITSSQVCGQWVARGRSCIHVVAWTG